MLVKTARTDSVAAGARTTAAIDAADLLRAEGRCAEAEALLVGLEPQFVSEQISVGRALTIRALCKLDAGDAIAARALARRRSRKRRRSAAVFPDAGTGRDRRRRSRRRDAHGGRAARDGGR
jgi:hypothetical protein